MSYLIKKEGGGERKVRYIFTSEEKNGCYVGIYRYDIDTFLQLCNQLHFINRAYVTTLYFKKNRIYFPLC